MIRQPMVFCDRGAVRRLSGLAVAGALGVWGVWSQLIWMPGQSWQGPLVPTAAERRLAARLESDLRYLAGEIGERNVLVPRQLGEAADWIERELRAVGYPVRRFTWTAQGETVCNLVAERAGTLSDAVVIVGAHYDTSPGCPGANDNGTGVVASLALARAFARRAPDLTTRFVFFANEEPPFFWTTEQGSLRYAGYCRRCGDKVALMVCLETLGCYRSEPGSQRYPVPGLRLWYPSSGEWVGFIGHHRWRRELRESLAVFRATTRFPAQGLAGFTAIPGIGWSDHWSFWQHNYPALMVTDTAPFRYDAYHTAEDTPDRVDYLRLARVVQGLDHVVAWHAGAEEDPAAAARTVR